jgi:hypothetical protein
MFVCHVYSHFYQYVDSCASFVYDATVKWPKETILNFNRIKCSKDSIFNKYTRQIVVVSVVEWTNVSNSTGLTIHQE